MTTHRTFGIRGTHPGCGKDTVANMLTERLTELTGKQITQAKFATPLRECVQVLTGISVQESETVQGKNTYLPDFGMTVGQFLQHFGTNVVRNHVGNDNVWVNALFRRFQPTDIVVISDVRFVNEQNAVKARNGLVILVTSNRNVDSRQMAGRSTAHASERNLDGIEPDYVIANDGTLDDLAKEVDRVLAQVSMVQ